ncbi:hypothetical protein B0H10DRAFT_1847032 [Mycena sp. CBHHK59/15]|nr:hypothetical protein B0H10DRAFT_1847032 [Mycena sp. CBHHK59/15]
MPRCSVCTKKFFNTTHLLSHMNQPNGRCHSSLHSASFKIRHRNPQRKLNLPRSNAQRVSSRSTEHVEFEIAPMDVDYEADVNYGPEMNLEEESFDTQKAYREEFTGAAQVQPGGDTFKAVFERDQYAEQRKLNMYYPFASRDEWELVSFIVRSNMTLAATDEFLKLRLVLKMCLSFSTAKDLRSRVEMLPMGPQWTTKPWESIHPTKSALTLFYRDPLECLQSLLQNPLIQDYIHFTPFRLYKTAGKTMRVYNEWLSGDAAWRIQAIQEKLPKGATVLGTILSSDKTQISAMTGNRQAHPVLISLADIDMDFRMKATHHAFLLLALLPIPKFLEKNKEIKGVLTSRLFHANMDFILGPLKIAAQIGIMMSDPLGWPAHTLSQLEALEEDTDPWNLTVYMKKAKEKRLNGVHRPFWRDWPLAEPSEFLTPEPLHHWTKMFGDHEKKWCIAAVGAAEIDFRFSVLRPHTGMRHFKDGISNSKQVTGRENRDIQRYIVPVVANTDGVSKDFLIAIRSLHDFRYYGQAPEMDENTLSKMDEALKCFHDHKHAILKAGVRTGKKGRINNWHIPKLEFMQSVVPNTKANGIPLQWTADVTEHAHITEVKDPADNSNNQNYEQQICRHLDRREKCARFDLGTAISDAGVDLGVPQSATFHDDDLNTIYDEEAPLLLNSTSELLEKIEPVARLLGAKRSIPNYFAESLQLQQGKFPNAKRPFRTFVSCQGNVAFHLSRDHTGRQLTIDEAAAKFQLPDLKSALLNYLHRIHHGDNFTIGGRRPSFGNSILPFKYLQCWNGLRMQGKAYHHSEQVLVPETVKASPPSKDWKFGRGDAVIVNTDCQEKWPHSGLQGHMVAHLRMIICVVPFNKDAPPPGTNQFLAYVQRFDVVPQKNPTTGVRGLFPEPTSSLYQLKRARRTDNSILGDIVPLERLRAPVEITPRFGKNADRRLTKETSLDFVDDFWLSKYFNKELFFALSQ